jgi:hypothetical protein
MRIHDEPAGCSAKRSSRRLFSISFSQLCKHAMNRGFDFKQSPQQAAFFQQQQQAVIQQQIAEYEAFQDMYSRFAPQSLTARYTCKHRILQSSPACFAVLHFVRRAHSRKAKEKRVLCVQSERTHSCTRFTRMCIRIRIC